MGFSYRVQVGVLVLGLGAALAACQSEPAKTSDQKPADAAKSVQKAEKKASQRTNPELLQILASSDEGTEISGAFEAFSIHLQNGPTVADYDLIDKLIALSANPKPNVRGVALSLLNQLHDDSINTKSLSDAERAQVRPAQDKILPAMVARASDPDSGVRFRVAEALRAYHEPRVVDALLALAKDQDPGVRVKAFASMRFVLEQAPDKFVAAAQAAKDDPDNGVKDAAGAVVTAKGPASAP